MQMSTYKKKLDFTVGVNTCLSPTRKKEQKVPIIGHCPLEKTRVIQQMLSAYSQLIFVVKSANHMLIDESATLFVGELNIF